MQEAKVLVVDDSAAMRALFCDILDQARHVQVVGTASNADEAREKIKELRPNVLTLDVEMPGTSGMEFLVEIMSNRPMPVVMLSSVAQAGTGTALKAIELGAVDCFPKPLHTSQDEFNATVQKLGEVVLAAANSDTEPESDTNAVEGEVAIDFEWNGRFVALSGSISGVEALKQILAAFPSNCPPTIVTLPIEPSTAKSFIQMASASYACTVKPAEDGAALEQGVAHICYDPAKHAIVEKGEPACVRLVDRDAIAGVRPSADLLFGSLARTGLPTIAAVLSGSGGDGVKGVTMLNQAGCPAIVQDPRTAVFPETPRMVLAANPQVEALAIEALHKRILEQCSG